MSGSGSKEMSDTEYFRNWPNQCPYNDDLKWASSVGIQYLQKIAPIYKTNGRTGIIIFDIDDTLIFGDPGVKLDKHGEEVGVVGVEPGSLGKHLDSNGKLVDVFFLPVNVSIVKIATVAKQLGFTVYCMTARPKESELASIVNLKMFQIPCDKLIMNEKVEDPFFKVRVRRKINEIPNTDIVLTVGDQTNDVYLPSKSAVIKLPDPTRKCAYAYIPS